MATAAIADRCITVRKNSPKPKITSVILSRGDRLNSMNDAFFEQLGAAFKDIDEDGDETRVAVLFAEGRMFSAGLNLKEVGTILAGNDDNEVEKNLHVYRLINKWQQSLEQIHRCKKPVIVAIHGHCIGGALDLASACDIRMCSKDASFAIRETKIAIVADIGTLQRIGRIVGPGVAREMAFTGDPIDADSAHSCKLVTKVFQDRDKLLEGAFELASQIASNSPITVQGTKLVLNHSDEHPDLRDSLQFVALWNSAFLRHNDLAEAMMSFAQRRQPVFSSKL